MNQGFSVLLHSTYVISQQIHIIKLMCPIIVLWDDTPLVDVNSI
jgi:hypothetical protein